MTADHARDSLPRGVRLKVIVPAILLLACAAGALAWWQSTKTRRAQDARQKEHLDRVEKLRQTASGEAAKNEFAAAARTLDLAEVEFRSKPELASGYGQDVQRTRELIKHTRALIATHQEAFLRVVISNAANRLELADPTGARRWVQDAARRCGADDPVLVGIVRVVDAFESLDFAAARAAANFLPLAGKERDELASSIPDRHERQTASYLSVLLLLRADKIDEALKSAREGPVRDLASFMDYYASGLFGSASYELRGHASLAGKARTYAKALYDLAEESERKARRAELPALKKLASLLAEAIRELESGSAEEARKILADDPSPTGSAAGEYFALVAKGDCEGALAALDSVPFRLQRDELLSPHFKKMEDLAKAGLVDTRRRLEEIARKSERGTEGTSPDPAFVPTIRGGALVWQPSTGWHSSNSLLPKERRARPDDPDITVFVLGGRRWEKVGEYKPIGSKEEKTCPGYEERLTVFVVHWPGGKCAGAIELPGSKLSLIEWRPTRDGTVRGDPVTDQDIARWIERLRRE